MHAMMLLAKRDAPGATEDYTMSNDAMTITPKELAIIAREMGVNATGKQLRAFIRNEDERNGGIEGVHACGAGNRYAFNRAEASAIIGAFSAKRKSSGASVADAASLVAWLTMSDDPSIVGVSDDDEGDEGDA